MPAHINHIATVLPPYSYSQEAIRNYLLKHSKKAFPIQTLFNESIIQQRYSVLSDLYLPEPIGLYTLEARMAIYKKEAPALAIQAIQKLPIDLADITHIITVSCTGLYAPGLDIDIQQQLRLAPGTQRHAINYMGCYASFHGLRLAHLILNEQPQAKVVLVSVELCSLHLQHHTDVESLAAYTLFGDGAAAVLLSATPIGPVIQNYHSYLLPDTASLMQWNVTSTAFEMVLHKSIPHHITTHLPEVLKDAYEKGIQPPDTFVVHPGGKEILNAFAQAIPESQSDLEISKAILKRLGNMSSVTILFVLESYQVQGWKGSYLACGFGPGLTVELLSLQA